jgi:hypothetical protein
MGSTCGCLARETEEEVLPFPSDIALSRIFPGTFNDAPNEQIQVPVIDLEKKFTEIINNLTITSPNINVLSLFTGRPSVIVWVLLCFLYV